ncbi:MAG: glycosyltransferase family 4 protein [Candidatus Latescibacterota bacterium]|nr:MAG: glycosyltransferase family 4 protein [Candidatus Latescibacterota bacterium]
MRSLFLTKYTRRGPSSRYRVYQFLDFYRQAGIEPTVAPLFDDDYLDYVYTSRSAPKSKLTAAFLKRLTFLLRSRSWDLVHVQCELFPHVPGLFETLFSIWNPRYVVEYDDAVFETYKTKWWVRGKIPALMKKARAVIVGNEYIESFATQFSKRVHFVPTCVDLNKYEVKNHEVQNEGGITVGWIGTPYTAKRYLLAFREHLKAMLDAAGVSFEFIGAPDGLDIGVPYRAVEWSEASEAELLKRVDVGIMPITDDAFSRGKSGLKLIQYMACGLPVVASPVGENRNLVATGENGYLADAPDEWARGIRSLAADPSLRHRLGMNGRRTVEASYSVSVHAPRLVNILYEAAGQTPSKTDFTSGPEE